MVKKMAWLHSFGWRSSACLATLTALVVIPLVPQLVQGVQQKKEQQTNPYKATPDIVERGHQFFANNCGICHGFNAQGGDRGPSLISGHFSHGSTDAELFRNIVHGIPETSMPANDFPPEQIWAIITFLRSKVIAAKTPIEGSQEAGEKYFWGAGKCGTCHMVNGKGGVLGPDLSHTGSRHTVNYFTQKVRDPNKELSAGLREPNADYVFPMANVAVTVVTAKGRRVTGVRKNEDTFSIQILGTDGRLHLFLKKDLKEVIREQKSLMPSYDEHALSKETLKDLLAYMATLE